MQQILFENLLNAFTFKFVPPEQNAQKGHIQLRGASLQLGNVLFPVAFRVFPQIAHSIDSF